MLLTVSGEFRRIFPDRVAQQELVKFLGRLLEVVGTMMMAEERAGSDRHRREARERMKRALEIVAQFTARLEDDVLDA